MGISQKAINRIYDSHNSNELIKNLKTLIKALIHDNKTVKNLIENYIKNEKNNTFIKTLKHININVDNLDNFDYSYIKSLNL